jgi:hypothetical protein
VTSHVVTYQVDDGTTVSFEIQPAEGFRPASSGHVLGKVRDAVAPSIEAAKAVLDKAKEICPDEIELTFGIKVSGGADWLIARSAGEASFEVKLTWSPKDASDSTPPARSVSADPGDATAEGVDVAEPAQE